MARLSEHPITPARIKIAYAAAITTDVLQWILGPLGWTFADEALDLVVAILMWRLLGFHPLLLPTLVLEFLPLVDMLPTWTGCVAAVVALKRRKSAGGKPGSSRPVIDI